MKMILYGLCLIFLLPAGLFSQEKRSFITESDKKLRKGGIYLFCKGTRAKRLIVAKNFNLYDTNSTHVGIGIFEKQKLVIYNVINATGLNALVKDSLGSFINGEDVSYCSIWKVKNSKREIRKLRRYFNFVQQRPIQFDFMFDLDNGDNMLYCSEFCQQALRKINPEKYSFYPTQIELNNLLYEKILTRKILNYFPVDFFEQSIFIHKIYEDFFPMDIDTFHQL